MLSQIEHIANKLNRIYNISSIPYVIFSDKGVDLLHRPQIRDFYYPCSFLEASYPLVKNNAYPYIIPLQETVYIGMFKTEDYALILGPVSSRPDTNLVDLLIQKEHSDNYSVLIMSLVIAGLFPCLSLLTCYLLFLRHVGILIFPLRRFWKSVISLLTHTGKKQSAIFCATTRKYLTFVFSKYHFLI